MAGFDILAQDESSTGSVTQSGSLFPVSAGFGMLFGSAAGAIPRDIILEGGLRGIAMNGKTQSPILYSEPCETVLAVATLSGTATTPQLIKIMGGMTEVEFTRVSFRRFSALSPDNLSGGLYTMPPDANGVWNEQAVVIPANTPLGGLSGKKTKRVICAELLHRPTALYYRPGGRASSALTFEVSVWGMPKWALNHVKPKA